jgi:hypothetical protein
MIDLLKLHALADDELSAEESRQVREQILSSEASSRELSAIHNLKDCVRTKAQVFTCEATLVASMKRVVVLDRKRQVDSFVTRYAWGISGAFLALIAIGGVMNRTVTANHVQSSEIASAFAKLLPSPGRQAAPLTQEALHYNRWLDNLVKQAKETSADPNQIHVLGVNLVDLEGRQVFRLQLRDGEGDLALLVIPGSVTIEGMGDSPATGPYISGKINGMNCLARNLGARSLILLGDRSYDQLADTLGRIVLSNP